MEGTVVLAIRSMSETKRVRYLLGLCSPAERERIELEYFEDDDAFQEMLTTEDDLIDAYACGELAGEEKQRFKGGFVNRPRGRARVQFARAFAGAVSAPRSVETKLPGTRLNIFPSPLLLRTAIIATVIVFVTVFAWLVIGRSKMTNELRELRAQSAELSKRNETLQQTSDAERTRTAEMAAQLADLRSRPFHELGITSTQRPQYVPEVKNAPEIKITELPIEGRRFANPSNIGGTVRGTTKDPNGNVVSGATVTLTDPAKNFTRTQFSNEVGAYVFNAVPPGTYSIKVQAKGFKTASASGLAALVDTPTVWDMQLEIGDVSESVDVTSTAEAAINTSDATLGNSFEPKRITELPLNANNVVGLLSLQPGVSSDTDFVNGGRSDQSNITLDGVDAAIRIPSSLNWIRFQIVLKTAAIHEDYRVVIKSSDGRSVTSVDWAEPLTPNQTIIDTPAISTSDLPSGDYVLVLMGKQSDGSFVKVTECSFKVIKY